MGKTFEDWLYEMEGFHVRAERILDDLEGADVKRLRDWLLAAFNAGKESQVGEESDRSES